MFYLSHHKLTPWTDPQIKTMFKVTTQSRVHSQLLTTSKTWKLQFEPSLATDTATKLLNHIQQTPFAFFQQTPFAFRESQKRWKRENKKNNLLNYFYEVIISFKGFDQPLTQSFFDIFGQYWRTHVFPTYYFTIIL